MPFRDRDYLRHRDARGGCDGDALRDAVFEDVSRMLDRQSDRGRSEDRIHDVFRAPGMERADGTNPNLPLTLWTYPSVLPAVRLGVAWDVFGNGNTAIRTGFGQFYNLGSTQISQNSSGNPPDTYNRAVYYSAVDKIPGLAGSAGITPIAPDGTVGKQKVQQTYNGSFMIQQKVGFGTVLEAAYVFNLNKHRPVRRPINPVPIFSQYNPANYNPNVAYLPPNTSGKNLNDNYFRPLPGLGNLRSVDFSGNGSYNSLQVTVRRNFTKRLSYGLAYTWSKTMTAFSTGELPAGGPYFTDKIPRLRSLLCSHAARDRGQLRLRIARSRSQIASPAAGMGDGPLDSFRNHAVAQQYSCGRPRHLVLRDHYHESPNELDRRRRGRADARGGRPATAQRAGVVRGQYAAGAGGGRDCQRHAGQSPPE